MALSEKTRVNLPIVGFVTLLISIASGVWWLAAIWHKQELIYSEVKGGIKLEDFTEFAHQLERANRKIGLEVPDPKRIVRERLTGDSGSDSTPATSRDRAGIGKQPSL